MSSCRTYNVVLKEKSATGDPLTLKVVAEAVNLTTDGEHDENAWFNFTQDCPDAEEDVTIAAIPYREVLYINAA